MSRPRRRKVEIPAAGSVLDELYAYRPPQPDPAGQPPQPTVEQVDQEPEPAPSPEPPPLGRTSRPAPPGMTRSTWYVPETAARELSAAADRITQQLGGLVPRHRVLAALMAAAVGQEQAVRDRLRAELLAELDRDETE